MARFSKLCDIQDGRPFSQYLVPRGHFCTIIIENKIQKDPVLARPEPISNTVYNILE